MSTGVEIIEQQSNDPHFSVAELLSRALFTAKTLQQTPFVEWMKRENDGYTKDTPLPEYRTGLTGTLVAWMPGHGWIQAPVDNATDADLSHTDFFAGIGDLEKEFVENRRSGGLRVDFTAERLAEVQKITSLQTRMALAIPASAHARTLETVRGVIRLWSADLLELGVTGMPTSDREKEREAAEPVKQRLKDYLSRANDEAGEWAEKASQKPGLFKRMLGLGG